MREDAVVGGLVGPLEILLTQALGEKGVDAHAGAHGQGDHNVLNGEGHTDGGEGPLADLGHEYAVHHVIEGLNQHGQHHRHRTWTAGACSQA